MNVGGSGGGISWTMIGQENRGVWRFGHEAPEGASVARIHYEGGSTKYRSDTAIS